MYTSGWFHFSASYPVVCLGASLQPTLPALWHLGTSHGKSMANANPIHVQVPLISLGKLSEETETPRRFPIKNRCRIPVPELNKGFFYRKPFKLLEKLKSFLIFFHTVFPLKPPNPWSLSLLHWRRDFHQIDQVQLLRQPQPKSSLKVGNWTAINIQYSMYQDR